MKKRSLTRWLAETGRTEVLGAMRIAFGCFLFAQAFDAYRELGEIGYFGDLFHMSFLPAKWVASRAFYTYLLDTRLVLAVMVALGLQARPALAVSSLLGLYTLACDRLQYHHNRYALLLYAFLLALTPCDRSWRLVGRRTKEDEIGPMWAVWLARAQVSFVYLASGGSKLLDPDWRGGLMMAQRFSQYGYQAVDKGVPQSVVDFLSTPTMTSLIAKGAIFSELFIACALWSPRLRRVALWWGMLFHLTIETTSQVELFTWVTLVAYAFFATMDARARTFEADGSKPLGRFLVRAVRALDWLSRFDAHTWQPDAATSKHTVVVTRRDGKRVTGLAAWVVVAEATPLLFPMWAPLAFVATFRQKD